MHCFQPGLFCCLQGFITGREITDIDDFFVDEGQEEVDISCHLGFLLQDAGIRVDEQGASQGVRAIFGALGIG